MKFLAFLNRFRRDDDFYRPEKFLTKFLFAMNLPLSILQMFFVFYYYSDNFVGKYKYGQFFICFYTFCLLYVAWSGVFRFDYMIKKMEDYGKSIFADITMIWIVFGNFTMFSILYFSATFYSYHIIATEISRT